MKSCLIADDHVLMREALAGTVAIGWPAATITEVGDFRSAWTAAAAQPDVAIVDLMMPGATPRAGIAGLRAAAPTAAILVVTGTDDDRLMLDLLDLGIAGFAAKTSSGAVIEAALRLIDAGGRYLPPRLAEDSRRARRRARSAGPDRPRGVGSRPPGLTDRQRDVLRLVARGFEQGDRRPPQPRARDGEDPSRPNPTVLGAKN